MLSDVLQAFVYLPKAAPLIRRRAPIIITMASSHLKTSAVRISQKMFDLLNAQVGR